jgi:hypothetical protein
VRLDRAASHEACVCACDVERCGPGLQLEKAREIAESAARKRAAIKHAARLAKKKTPAPASGTARVIGVWKLSPGSAASKTKRASGSAGAATTPSAVTAADASTLAASHGSGLAQSVSDAPELAPIPAHGMHRIHMVADPDSASTGVSHLNESTKLQWEWLKRAPRAAAAILALRRVMHSTAVVALISTLIVMNTVVLGLDKYPLWDDDLVRARGFARAMRVCGVCLCF